MFLLVTIANCQNPGDTEIWEPVPEKVEPGNVNIEAPDDAIILFDGSGFEHWVSSEDGSEVQWNIENGYMTVNPGTGNIETKNKFKNLQLHIEWRSPEVVEEEGQGRGNSGVFLQKRYEVQVLDSWNNETYVNGMAGSIYKQHIPLVNASLPPGEWQSYDIFFKSPEFSDDGTVKSPGRITVLHNGVLIQNNVEIKGNTVYIGEPYYESHGADSIMLQDHSDLVSYRNIWVREL